MSQRTNIEITEAELLAVSVAKSTDKNFVVFSLRLDTDSFESTNIGISADQAVRLWRDLSSLGLTSEILKQEFNSNPSLYDNYENIILDKKLSKKRGRPRKNQNG